MDLAVALGYRSGEYFRSLRFHFRKALCIERPVTRSFFIASCIKHYIILTPDICFRGVQSKQIPIKLRNEFTYWTFS